PYERRLYGINFPYIYPDEKITFDKLPNIRIANFPALAGGPVSYSAGPIYTISNNTTEVIRSHMLKWGVLFEHSGENDFDQPNAGFENGGFTFSDARTGFATTGLAVANAVLGLFDTYQEIGQRAYTPYRGNMAEAFVQDSWKATPRLRVEAGLRYTIQQPY